MKCCKNFGLKENRDDDLEGDNIVNLLEK